MNHQSRGCKQQQAGMTLIEVLVAALILGLGLLGAASAQINALKYTDSARMSTQASFIAYDMLDRMRANATGDYRFSGVDVATFTGMTRVLRKKTPPFNPSPSPAIWPTNRLRVSHETG